LIDAARNVQQFQRESLSAQLASIERELTSKDQTGLSDLYMALGITPLLLDSGLVLKQAAAQVNVLVHASGEIVSSVRSPSAFHTHLLVPSAFARDGRYRTRRRHAARRL